MGNTHRTQLQSEKKKHKNQTLYLIISHLFLRKKFRYVYFEGDKDLYQLGKETQVEKFRKGLKYFKSERIVMNTENQVKEVDQQHKGTFVKDEVRSQEQNNVSVVDPLQKSSEQISSNLFSNLHENNNEERESESGNSTSVKTHDHDSTTIIPILENQIPSASFSTLWLPFKSPFRRPFFSTSNKHATNANLNRLIEDIPNKVPMTSSSPYNHSDCIDKTKEHVEPIGTQHSNYTPWTHQYAIHQQQEKTKSISTACLQQGDIPISTSMSMENAFSSESFQTKNDASPATDDVVGDIVDKCCGIVPPLFQNTVRYESTEPEVDDFSTITTRFGEHQTREQKKKNHLNESRKQGGLIPIRLNRRGRNHTSRGTREQQNQEHQRVTHKKQRAAHQASSPSATSTSLSRLGSFNKSLCRGRDTSPPPSVRLINGHKVTMIDEELKVFVVDLLTPEICDLVRSMADDHVKMVNENGNNIATWRTLYTYTKRDLPCSEVKGLTSRITDHIMTNIINIVGAIFEKKEEAAKLHPRSWKEPHLLLYQKFKNQIPHTGVEMHYDGCDITWNCMLSKSTGYDGGGTYIRALRKTIRLEQGQVLVHPGELYHKGCDITRGERALIVCFMDGFDPQIVDPSSAQEDKEIYEKNIRMY